MVAGTIAEARARACLSPFVNVETFIPPGQVILIDGAPEPVFLASDADDHLIQVPDIVGLGSLRRARDHSSVRIFVPTGGLSHRT
jgi:hypothetical protein